MHLLLKLSEDRKSNTLAVRKDNKVTQIKKSDFLKQIEKEKEEKK